MVFYGRCLLVTGWLAWATWWQKRRSVVRMTLGWTPRSDTQSGEPWSSRTTKETGHYAQRLGREWKQVHLSSPVKLKVVPYDCWQPTNDINLQFDFYLGVQGVPGRPGHKGVRGIPGSPGYFKMFYKNLRTGENESFTLPENPNGMIMHPDIGPR